VGRIRIAYSPLQIENRYVANRDKNGQIFNLVTYIRYVTNIFRNGFFPYAVRDFLKKKVTFNVFLMRFLMKAVNLCHLSSFIYSSAKKFFL
jgi:hypothetical protein